ncbi:MAG: SCP-like extracellular [Firmicutes bacterium]|nr:SCP-like extracellular [Bacillota bacterium]
MPQKQKKGKITMVKNKLSRKLKLGLLALAFITAVGSSALPIPVCAAKPQYAIQDLQPRGGLSNEEQLAFTLLNADREANGLSPLKLNLAISAVAQRHAQDEIDRAFFAHNNPDGLSPFDRMHAAGITFRYAGENLAIDQDVTAAEQALMNSSGHRANILSPDFTEVGIGIRFNSQGSLYIVQCFIGR